MQVVDEKGIWSKKKADAQSQRSTLGEDNALYRYRPFLYGLPYTIMIFIRFLLQVHRTLLQNGLGHSIDPVTFLYLKA